MERRVGRRCFRRPPRSSGAAVLTSMVRSMVLVLDGNLEVGEHPVILSVPDIFLSEVVEKFVIIFKNICFPSCVHNVSL